MAQVKLRVSSASWTETRVGCANEGSHRHQKDPLKPNVVTVPDLLGCVTTANTLSEAEANTREAIEGHLLTLHESGEAIPLPSTVAREIEVTSAA